MKDGKFESVVEIYRALINGETIYNPIRDLIIKLQDGDLFDEKSGCNRNIYFYLPLDWEIYVSPKLHITEADVGKRVRFRNGNVFVIDGFIKDPEYPVHVSNYALTQSGQFYIDETEDELDIVEILD